MTKKKNRNKKNGLEKEFEDILNELNINYEFHFWYHKKEYDFILPDYNILIEVDGDFFHCNKKIGYKPLYSIQRKNIRNDRVKNRIVKKYKEYKLLRFWENDIKNKRDDVISKLRKVIS